jgi:nucleoid-associated protein YgaU
MQNTDLSRVTKYHTHSLVSLRKPLRCGFAIVLCSCLFYGAAQCGAQEAQSQDVAEAARQERVRREQPDKPRHVYTDEDLRRAKILTPEDEARLAAKHKLEPGPPVEQNTPDVLDANGELGQLPLGDIARYYRRAKLATQPAFLLPFDEPELASPVQPIEVRPDFASPVTPRIVWPHARAAAAPSISSPAPVQRRDPFSRRLVPIRPNTQRTLAAPNAAPSAPAAVTPTPAIPQPNFTPRSAVSSITAVPARPAPRVLSAPTLVPSTPAAVTPEPAIPQRGFSAASPVPPIAAVPAKPSVPRVFSEPTPVPNSASVVAPAPLIPGPGFAAKSTVPSIAAVPEPPASPAAVSPATVTPAPVNPAIVNPNAPVTGVHTIVVQRGDSLWKIAERTLGRGSRWREVLAANPSVVSPESLKAGMQVVVPVDVRAPRTEKVKVIAGDTLTKIAQAQYGRASYWRCIAEANPDIADANRIFEGQQLRLPLRCKP